ncbi:hypothetical protein [Spiroplasma sp. AdecLV25b]|uniref:hypothetical protein n=1 Tax=Spiroplasma sp. AdecLV25b TaxID=3027162 RepID=UPI0027E1612C|nr:hypothetical protein [Spiroplasma sp. AdecLV25b]
MRKLLSLLTVLILTVPVPLNVVACGSKANPTPNPDNEPIDTIGLLKTAENKISELFGNLIIENKNLLKPSNFGQKNTGSLLTGVDAAAVGVISNLALTNSFYDIFKENIKSFGSYLANDEKLKLLFYGINSNEILKLDENKSTINKKTFEEWKQDGAFGISDYTSTKYKVDSWNYLSSRLVLTLKYKANDGQITDYELDQNYDFYLANDEAQLSTIVHLASDNVVNNLKNYLIEIKGNNKFNLSKWIQDQDLLQNFKNNITTKINNSKVTIIDSNLDETSVMTGNVLDGSEPTIFTKDKQQVIQDIKNLASKNNEEFEKKLNSWTSKSLIAPQDLDKVTLIGSYQLNNWKYNDLILIPTKISTVVIGNQTRNEKIEDDSNKFAELFSTEGILINKFWNTKLGDASYDTGFVMNASDFDAYDTNNSTFNDALLYMSEKVKSFAVSKNILNSSDFCTCINYYNGSDIGNTILNTKK